MDKITIYPLGTKTKTPEPQKLLMKTIFINKIYTAFIKLMAVSARKKV